MTDADPRSVADIVSDLLQVVQSHEWLHIYDSRHDEHYDVCCKCGAHRNWYLGEDEEHEPDCEWVRITREAEAFLLAERELGNDH